jgi:hypothetical protein
MVRILFQFDECLPHYAASSELKGSTEDAVCKGALVNQYLEGFCTGSSHLRGNLCGVLESLRQFCCPLKPGAPIAENDSLPFQVGIELELSFTALNASSSRINTFRPVCKEANSELPQLAHRLSGAADLDYGSKHLRALAGLSGALRLYHCQCRL